MSGSIKLLKQQAKKIELLELEVSMLRERNTRLDIATKLAAGMLANPEHYYIDKSDYKPIANNAFGLADHLITKSKEGGAE